MNFRDLFSMTLVALLLAQHEQIKPLDFLARPGCLAQKLQAGRNTGVTDKATHWNALAQLLPAVMRDQFRHDGLQSEAMQGIAWLGGNSGWCL